MTLAPDSQGATARAMELRKNIHAKSNYVYVPETQLAPDNEPLDYSNDVDILAPDSQGASALAISLRLANTDNVSIPETQMTDNLVNISKTRMATVNNYTISSIGLNSVILIKSTQGGNVNLTRNPIKFHKALSATEFSKHEIKDIRPNYKLDIIAVELKEPTLQIMEKLLQVRKVGDWDVECYIPNSDKYKMGVISPIGEDTDMDELLAYIKPRDSDARVEKVERLKRKTDAGWVDSASVKITFIGENLPDRVSVAHALYKVRAYVREPRQCYKCLGFYHFAKSCNYKCLGFYHFAKSCKNTVQKCLLCGGNHPKDSCTKLPDQFRCANCNGNHKANSKECHYYDAARQVEVLKSSTNTTYLQAKKTVMENYQPVTLTNDGISYRDKVLGNLQIQNKISNLQPTRVNKPDLNNNIQTETTANVQQSNLQSEHSCDTKQALLAMEKKFLQKITYMLLEVLRGIGKTGKNKPSPGSLIESAIRTHFGLTLSLSDDSELSTDDAPNEAQQGTKRKTVEPVTARAQKKKKKGRNY